MNAWLNSLNRWAMRCTATFYGRPGQASNGPYPANIFLGNHLTGRGFFSVRAHRKTLVIRQQAFRHVFSSNLLSSFHLSFPAHGIRPRFPHIPSPVQHAGNEAVGPARARGANTGRPPCRGLTVILQKRRRQLACQRRGSFPNATLPQIPGYKA